MLSIWRISPILIIGVSFIAGFIFFYIFSNLHKTEKKEHIQEITSLIINFIIFIWIAKILLNFNLLIKDPFAGLAYPSNSNSFYLAIVFITVNIFIKVKRESFPFMSILY